MADKINILERFSLKGKVALLTGGAGLYGTQLAEALYEAGATTYIASRNLEALEKVCAKYPGMRAIQLDLGDEASVKNVIAEIEKQSGRLDILVNNAVTRCACANWNLSMDDFDNSLRVNASSMFILTREAMELMRKNNNGQGSGSVVNIGSYMGVRGINYTNYAGTSMYADDYPSPIYFYEKGGMVNFTRFAATVLGKYNIRVNCLLPGGLADERQPKEFQTNYGKNTPLGRLAGPEDLKGALVFLASDASSYITGTSLPVDGGYVAK